MWRAFGRAGVSARLNARRSARDTLTAADARFAYARLAAFFSGVVLALAAMLAAWLTTAADPPEIRARQGAVAEEAAAREFTGGQKSEE
jgi:hypothetical protein